MDRSGPPLVLNSANRNWALTYTRASRPEGRGRTAAWYFSSEEMLGLVPRTVSATASTMETSLPRTAVWPAKAYTSTSLRWLFPLSRPMLIGTLPRVSTVQVRLRPSGPERSLPSATRAERSSFAAISSATWGSPSTTLTMSPTCDPSHGRTSERNDQPVRDCSRKEFMRRSSCASIPPLDRSWGNFPRRPRRFIFCLREGSR